MSLRALSAIALPLALVACGGSKSSSEPTAHLRVTVVAAGVFRVQLSQSADFPEIPSFAVDPSVLAGSTPMTIDTADPEPVTVRSGAAALRIGKEPLTLALLDGSGNVVAEEAAPIAWTDNGAALPKGATVSWKLPADEHVYGLGDKVGGGMDRRGHKYLMWNTDHYRWTVTGTASDPLYKSIPDLLFVKEGGVAHGLFIDNPSRATVDVGATAPGVLSYAAERATTMDLYLIAGPAPRDVVAAYTALTGRTPLPPRWSLGYNQSRYSYTTEADARAVAAHLRADDIPADVMWLDIHYQEHNAPFTVDTDAFPNFSGMIADFAAMGLETVLIVDLHIRQRPGDPQYDSGVAGNHFIKNPNGTELAGGVWPLLNPAPFNLRSVFPEFTLAGARAWWGTLFTTFVGYGAAGFWNDMNEPSIPFDTVMFPERTFHDDTPHRLEGGTAGPAADHVTIHNAYGMLNARATYEGQLALRPNARPFVLSRAAYAGSQRWGTTWTGDNSADRSHLAVTIPQLINLGVSGLAYSGADVGGYSGCPYPDTTGGSADANLLVEWMELGALQPFFRNHSEYGTCRREPWLLGPAVEARLRKAIERRYKLLPYIYTVFEESSRTGLPVMRPLWLEYPSDGTTLTNDKAFLLGRDLLVAPRLVAEGGPYQVALPASGWWDTVTGELIANGGTVTVTPPADDSLRVFARAGAIIPSQPVARTAGSTPEGELTLDVWPGADCSGSLYQDDGRSLDYQHGAMARVSYACQPSSTGITVTSASTGSFPNWWTATRLLIHGASAATAVTGPGGPLPSSYDAPTHTLAVTLDGSGSNWEIQASWGP